jgi:hypothetical protein
MPSSPLDHKPPQYLFGWSKGSRCGAWLWFIILFLIHQWKYNREWGGRSLLLVRQLARSYRSDKWEDNNWHCKEVQWYYLFNKSMCSSLYQWALPLQDQISELSFVHVASLSTSFADHTYTSCKKYLRSCLVGSSFHKVVQQLPTHGNSDSHGNSGSHGNSDKKQIELLLWKSHVTFFEIESYGPHHFYFSR